VVKWIRRLRLGEKIEKNTWVFERYRRFYWDFWAVMDVFLVCLGLLAVFLAFNSIQPAVMFTAGISLIALGIGVWRLRYVAVHEQQMLDKRLQRKKGKK